MYWGKIPENTTTTEMKIKPKWQIPFHNPYFLKHDFWQKNDGFQHCRHIQTNELQNTLQSSHFSDIIIKTWAMRGPWYYVFRIHILLELCIFWCVAPEISVGSKCAILTGIEGTKRCVECWLVIADKYCWAGRLIEWSKLNFAKILQQTTGIK